MKTGAVRRTLFWLTNRASQQVHLHARARIRTPGKPGHKQSLRFPKTIPVFIASNSAPESLWARDQNRCFNILASADEILSGRLRVFSSTLVEVKNSEVPWKFGTDPSGKPGFWPDCYWADLTPDNHALDPKLTWEINRCSHLVLLGKAYFLSQDEKYAHEAVVELRDWIRQNPFERGINWSSPLEVAFRAINWICTANLCQASAAWTGAVQAELLPSLWDHGHHIERYFEWHPYPDTHYLCEALGLLLLGITFQATAAGKRWARQGVQVLSDGLQRMFTPDGIYYELNLQYHAYALDFYLIATVLVRKLGLPDLPPQWDAMIQRILLATARLVDQDGNLPHIGDDDGGFAPNLAERQHGRDVRQALGLGAFLFQDGFLKAASRQQVESIFWFYGQTGLDVYDAIPDNEHEPASAVFPGSGYLVQRANRRALWFRCGKLGMGRYAGHGHADLLGITLHTEQGCQVVDPGTYTYNGDQFYRDYFRSTQAHNCLIIDRQNQAVRLNRFAWKDYPECQGLTWEEDPEFAWASAFIDYKHVRHSRSVLFAKPFYWLILDEVFGDGSHIVELIYHLRHSVSITDFGRVTIPGSSFSLTVVGRSLASGIHQGEQVIEPGWTSSAYGRKEQAPVFYARFRDELPLQIITFLSCSPDQTTRAMNVQREIQDIFSGPEVKLEVTGENFCHEVTLPSLKKKQQQAEAGRQLLFSLNDRSALLKISL